MRARGAARPALLLTLAILLAASLALLLRPAAPLAPLAAEGDATRAARRALRTAEELRVLPPRSPLLAVPRGAPSATYTGDANRPVALAPDETPALLVEWTVELLRWDAGNRAFVVVPGGAAHEALRVVVRVRAAPTSGGGGEPLSLRPVLARLTLHRLDPSPGEGGS